MKTLTVLRLTQVLAKTSLSKTTIYRLEAAGKFPKRVRLGENSTGWYAHEIDDFLATLGRVGSFETK